jgi:fructosamine-3-kinase
MARKYNIHYPTMCRIYHFELPLFQDYYTDKLQEQIDLIGNGSDMVKLWLLLKEKIGDFFKGLDIKPSLLHGDLWSGNYGQVDSDPVIYDAASFYGHHEYDLGIAGKFFFW